MEHEKIRKKKTHVRAKDNVSKDEVKELRRELEALKKQKLKKTVFDSDVSEDFEGEKAKRERRKAKGKEKAETTKDIEASDSGSDSNS